MRLKTLVCLSFALSLPATLVAQVIPDPPAGDHLVTLEMLHPSFKNAEGVSMLTGAWFVGGRYSVRPNVLLVAELPWSVLRFDEGGEMNSSAIGNAYLGAALRRQQLRYELGVRLPTAGTETSAVAGFVSDLTRAEAFMPDLMSVRGVVSYVKEHESVGGEVLVGTVVAVPTGDGGDTEFFADYGARLQAHPGALRLIAGLDGRAALSEEGSFSERTEHQLVGAASYGIGRFRPGVHARFALDQDRRDMLEGVFGVSLEVVLGPVPVRTARR